MPISIKIASEVIPKALMRVYPLHALLDIATKWEWNRKCVDMYC